jgi:c-di-GMP-related signal transduction protein
VLSLTPVILDIPTHTLSDELQLAEPLRNALVSQTGTLGEMLRIAGAFERGDAAEVASTCAALGALTPELVAALGMRATAWTQEM